MMLVLRSRLLYCTILVAIVSCVAPCATAAVIFEEDFTLRYLNAGVFGSRPNIANTGGATYVRSPELGALTEGKIGQYAPGIHGLLFQPESALGELPGAGGFNQNMALPFPYAFGTTPVRLTITARQGQARWNNFVFGFTNIDGGMTDWLLLQTPANLANTSLQLFHRDGHYSRIRIPAISADSFRTFVLEYNPAKANTVSVNPYTFSVDGTPIALAGANLPPIPSIGGIGWGFFFADGLFDRSVLIHSLKFEVLEPTILAGDFNGDGIVDAADYVLWRKQVVGGDDYAVWRQNFGMASVAAAEISAVAEPTISILLLPLPIAVDRRRRPE
jgi:hypothetical protein